MDTTKERDKAMKKAFSQKRNRIVNTILILLIISLFIPTPYYLFQPGSVEELGSKVTVEGGEKNSAGNLYLTTVLSLRASNIYYLAYGMVAPHTDLRKVKEVRGDLTDKEYSRMLEHMMTSSQQHALVAGLRAAGDDVIVEPSGIFVSSVLDMSDAAGRIEVGDIIRKIDGKPVHRSVDFLAFLSQKKQEIRLNLRLLEMERKKARKLSLSHFKIVQIKQG